MKVKVNVRVKVNEIITTVATRVVVSTMGLGMILTLLPSKSNYNKCFQHLN